MGAALLGCSPPAKSPSGSWQTYRNARYNFEFPYPDNWVAGQAPANGDGQAFSDPKNPVVELRGWAGYNVPAAHRKRSHNNNNDQPKPLKLNFTTEQGLSGELKVDLRSPESSMTLTLVEGDVRYNFQAKAPNKQFADYYKFFYYVASQYRVSSQPK